MRLEGDLVLCPHADCGKRVKWGRGGKSFRVHVWRCKNKQQCPHCHGRFEKRVYRLHAHLLCTKATVVVGFRNARITSTLYYNLLEAHVNEKCLEIPKARRPRKKRVTYTVGDAFNVVLQLKHFIHSFGGPKLLAVRKFLTRKKMRRETLQSLCKKVALYNEYPPPHGQKQKRKRSVCAGSGRKSSTVPTQMGN